MSSAAFEIIYRDKLWRIGLSEYGGEHALVEVGPIAQPSIAAARRPSVEGRLAPEPLLEDRHEVEGDPDTPFSLVLSAPFRRLFRFVKPSRGCLIKLR